MRVTRHAVADVVHEARDSGHLGDVIVVTESMQDVARDVRRQVRVPKPMLGVADRAEVRVAHFDVGEQLGVVLHDLERDPALWGRQRYGGRFRHA